MRIAIITDELSQHPLEAVEEGLKLGIRDFELRVVLGKRLPEGGQDNAPQLLALREQHGIRYSALSPGLFKCAPEPRLLDDHLNVRLEASIELAKTLGIATLICFAGIDMNVHRPRELRAYVFPWLQRATERAAAAGMRLAVETEFMSGCETGRDAAELARDIGSASFGINWDPANAWIAGEPPLEGWRHVRDHLAGVHVKDADTTEWRQRNPFVPLGSGKLPWGELIALLAADYPAAAPASETAPQAADLATEQTAERTKASRSASEAASEPASGTIGKGAPLLTVETHIEPLIENSRLSVERLRKLLSGLPSREGMAE